VSARTQQLRCGAALAISVALASCSLTVTTDDLVGGAAATPGVSGGDAEIVGADGSRGEAGTLPDATADAPGLDATTDATPDASPDASADANRPDVALPTLAYLQNANKLATSSATIQTATFGLLAAGTSIVCYSTYESSTGSITSISDAQGTAYTRAVGPTRGLGTFAAWSDEVWYAIGITGGSNLSVMATFDGAMSRSSLSCHAYAGVLAFEGGTGLAFATAGTNSTQGLTTKSPRALLFSAFGIVGTASPGANFVTRSTFDNDLLQDRFVAAPGTYLGMASCDAACNGSLLLFTAR